MSHAFKTLIPLILVAFSLVACGTPEFCGAGDAIDLAMLEQAAKENRVEELLGEPTKIVQTEDGRYDAYRYWSDRGCVTVGIFIVPLLIVPTDLPSSGYLTISYDKNGSFKSIRLWAHASSSEEAVENHQYWSKGERDLKEYCEIPFSEAATLDEVALRDRYEKCGFRSQLSKQSQIMWDCLFANAGYVSGRVYLGLYFEDRHKLTGDVSDLLESYKWFGLAVREGRGSNHHLKRVASQLSSAEISRAEKLVAEWQPNPSDCEALLQNGAVSAQPD
jgi:hypothetical protein